MNAKKKLQLKQQSANQQKPSGLPASAAALDKENTPTPRVIADRRNSVAVALADHETGSRKYR